MSTNGSKVPTVVEHPRPQAQSQQSFTSSLKSPRVARFAEATAVNSPTEPPRSPFTGISTNHYRPQLQPSDIGFGFVDDKHTSHVTVEMEDTDNYHLPRGRLDAPLSPPLKSAMKTPGTAPRNFGNILSPTFREEQVLEKREVSTEKEQARDIRIKTRVRVAKLFLRGINFACSLIVLAMLTTTFNIFNATKSLPHRSTGSSSFPPWAVGTNPWPQILLLVIACVSLVFAVLIFYAYFRGGHKRAEKVQTYYTVFAVGFFIFSVVMWGIGAGVLNTTRTSSGGQDLWGWSCKDNKRSEIFADVVDYALVCRLNNWSLVCSVIEIVVELTAIGVYSFVFYRVWSKRKLRKSMAVRDRARSDLYLAQLRSQSAPNTPGLNGPLSARDGGWRPPVDYYNAAPTIEEGPHEHGNVQYVDSSQQPAPAKPFVLQPPPVKGATPKMQQTGFTPIHPTSPPDTRSPSPTQIPAHALAVEQQQQHFGAAPGERVYEAVPIPGSYTSPLNSPTVAPRQMSFPAPGAR